MSFVCFYTNPAGTLILTRSQSDSRAFAFIMLSVRAVFYNQICGCVDVCELVGVGVGGRGRLTGQCILDHILLFQGCFLHWLELTEGDERKENIKCPQKGLLF